MAQMMKNQPSHWWWLDSHSNTRRSPWLQSTLNELNEKTKAMLKLIEEDADSFAKRAEMYYKKRPELVSMVQDFYRTHRSLAERYDQVKPDNGFRLLKTGGSPFASPKYQLEKLLSFADNGYDSYSENCDVEESVESEVEDPEQEEEEDTKFDNYCTKEKEVRFVAANDEVMRLRKEIERLSEENKAHKNQIKQKDTICDEAMMLREEVERLRKENRAQKDQLKQKDAICDEAMMLREEVERLSKENRAQKDQLKQKDAICDEAMMLREEVERLSKENRAQKDQLKQKDTICDELMMLKEEVGRLREENRAQKGRLKQKDEEKIEVIRHLSLAIDVLKQENVKMRSFIAKESTKKWKNPSEFSKLMGALSGKLFNGTTRNQTSVVAL